MAKQNKTLFRVAEYEFAGKTYKVDCWDFGTHFQCTCADAPGWTHDISKDVVKIEDDIQMVQPSLEEFVGASHIIAAFANNRFYVPDQGGQG